MPARSENRCVGTFSPTRPDSNFSLTSGTDWNCNTMVYSDKSKSGLLCVCEADWWDILWRCKSCFTENAGVPCVRPGLASFSSALICKWVCCYSSQTLQNVALSSSHVPRTVRAKNRNSTGIIFCTSLKILPTAMALSRMLFSSASVILSSCCSHHTRSTAVGLQLDPPHVHSEMVFTLVVCRRLVSFFLGG